MFSQPTVFVVGAGASCEFNMPSGADLKDLVGKRLDFRSSPDGVLLGDQNLHAILRNNFPDKYSDAARELSRAIRQVRYDSIDEVLQWFSSSDDILDLGKALIVRGILASERSTRLHNPSGPLAMPESTTDDSTWLSHFFSMAHSNLSQENITSAFSDVTIINFNYDRLIEHFLYSEFQNKLRIGERKAREVITGLKVIRPYGRVAALPWQEGPLAFGADVGDRLFAYSDNILTYTEQKVSTEIKQDIQTALDSAHIIVFLGFGFHQQNMTILNADRYPGSKHVLATALNLDLENYDNIKGVLRETLKCTSPPQLLNRTAADLMATMKTTILNPSIRRHWPDY